MKRDISLYLKDVFEHMKHAEAFIENLTHKEFIKDKKTSYAVARCIEIIGKLQKTSPRHYGLYDKTTLGEEL